MFLHKSFETTSCKNKYTRQFTVAYLFFMVLLCHGYGDISFQNVLLRDIFGTYKKLKIILKAETATEALKRECYGWRHGLQHISRCCVAAAP